MKVLDPAMGSGSFLLRAFDALMGAYEEYNEECRRHKRAKNGAGTLFEADFVVAEEVLDAPLIVLTENIFGVDLDAQAVEVAKLSLWLRYMAVNRTQFIDQLRRRRRGGQPLNLLPNLARNLKRGNSLIDDPAVAGDAAFVWQKEFPDIMQQGGFDVVIGNPPYVLLQDAFRDDKQVAFLRAQFKVASSRLTPTTCSSSEASVSRGLRGFVDYYACQFSHQHLPCGTPPLLDRAFEHRADSHH